MNSWIPACAGMMILNNWHWSTTFQSHTFRYLPFLHTQQILPSEAPFPANGPFALLHPSLLPITTLLLHLTSPQAEHLYIQITDISHLGHCIVITSYSYFDSHAKVETN